MVNTVTVLSTLADSLVWVCVCLWFQYNSFDDLERDFIQMCRNAQKYNEEASLIHEDSIVLETVFANARVRLEQDSEPAEEEEEEEEEGRGRKSWLGQRKYSVINVLLLACYRASLLPPPHTHTHTNFYFQN